MIHAARRMTKAEQPQLAQLWHSGWHEAHAAHVPAALVAMRSLSQFELRLTSMQETTRCAGAIGQPLGFCNIKDNEIDQMFVSDKARGTGLAAQLLKDGEGRLRANGTRTAILLCIPENLRAVAFYEKQGWLTRGLKLAQLSSPEGSFPLETLILEKRL